MAKAAIWTKAQSLVLFINGQVSNVCVIFYSDLSISTLLLLSMPEFKTTTLLQLKHLQYLLDFQMWKQDPHRGVEKLFQMMKKEFKIQNPKSKA